MGVLYAIGLVSLMLCDDSLVSLAIPLIICGLSGGWCITFATMMFGLRTLTPSDSSSVSGVAQSVGYLIAAAGPMTVGAVFDATSDWSSGLLLLAIVACSMIVLGYLVGRDHSIGSDTMS